MKVAFLGYGMAGLIFDAIASQCLPDVDVTFITMDTLPNSDFGLRYIHPPAPGDMVETTNKFSSLYGFISETMGPFMASTTIPMRFAIRTNKSGYVAGRTVGDKNDRADWVWDYCITNGRQHEPFAMNSYAVNPDPRRLAAPYDEVVSHILQQCNGQIRRGFIQDVDLIGKTVKYSTKLSEQREKFDLIINSIPLPVFSEMIDPDIINQDMQFNKSPTLCVRSHSSVPSVLDYIYNVGQDYDGWKNFNLSRVTLKDKMTDFEFSIHNKTLTSAPDIKKQFPKVKAVVMKVLKELDEFYSVNWSNNNFLAPNIIPYAHFEQTDDTFLAVEDIESTGCVMMGRYSRWDHGIKLPDMWNHALKVVEEIGGKYK